MSDDDPIPEHDPVRHHAGDAPVTGQLRTEVESVGRDAQTEIDPGALTEAEASQVIDRLHDEAGRFGDA